MKLSRWWSVFLLILVFIVFFAYHAFHFIQFSEKIEKILVGYIAPYLSGDFSVKKINLGLTTISMEEVRFEDEKRKNLIFIKAIKVRFGLVKLVQTRFSLNQSIKSITLFQPRLVVHAPLLSTQSQLSSKRFDLSELPLRKLKIEYGHLKILLPDSGQEVNLGNLNGWVKSLKEHNTFSLKGKFFSRKNNMEIKGSFDDELSTFEIALNLKSARIDKNIPVPRLPFYQVKGGRVDLQLSIIKQKRFVFKETAIFGEVRIREGVVGFPIGELIGLNAHYHIENNHLYIRQHQGKFYDHAVYLKGDVDNVLDPTFHLTLTSDSVNSNDQDNPHNGWPRGGQLEVVFKGHHQNLEVNGFFDGQGLPWHLFPLKTVTLTAQRKRNFLWVNRLEAVFESGRLEGYGEIYANRNIDLHFSSSTFNLKPLLKRAPLFRSWSDQVGPLQMHLFGDPTHLNFQGQIQSTFLGKSIRYKILGFHNSGEKLTDVTISDLQKRIFAHLQWRTDEETWRVEVDGQADHVLTGHFLSPFSIPVHHTFKLDGDREALHFRTESYLNNPEIGGTIVLKGKMFSNAKQSFCQGKMESHDWHFGRELFELNANFEADRDRIHLDDIRVGEVLTGDLEMGIINRSSLAGFLRFNEFPTRVFEPGLPQWLKPIVKSGQLSGQIELGGLLNKPILNGDLMLANLSIAKKEDVEGRLRFRTMGRAMTFRDFFLRNATTVFCQSDSFSFDADHVFLSARGKDIDLSVLSELLGIEEAYRIKILGRTTYQVVLKGTPQQVGFCEGIFQIRRPVINRIGYDDVTVRLYTQNDSLYVDGLQFQSAGGLRLETKVQFPLKFFSLIELSPNKGQIMIRASVKGDLLKLLPFPTGHFIQELKGKFFAEIQLEGPRNQFQISDIQLDFEEGELKPKAIFENGFQDIRARLNFHRKETAFASFEFSALNQGRRIEIKTARPELLTGGPFLLEKLEFLGIDFGVFICQTDKGGMILHLPGFMSKKASGEIALASKYSYPAFLVAGPWTQPWFVGQIILKNLDFTFPLEQTSRGNSNFFKNIRWDIDVVASQNTYYTRKIGGNFLFDVRLLIDRGNLLNIQGNLKEKTVRVAGKLRSTRGNIYYGENFNENILVEVEFSGDEIAENRYNNVPFLRGSAQIDRRSETFEGVFLTAYLTDPETGQESPYGRFYGNNLRFVPSRDIGLSEPAAKLNFTDLFMGAPVEQQFQKKDMLDRTRAVASKVGSKGAEMGDVYLTQRYLNPLSYRLKTVWPLNKLQLDIFSISTRNIYNFYQNYSQQVEAGRTSPSPVFQQYLLNPLSLFDRTHYMIGKYLNEDVFISYGGEFFYNLDNNAIGQRIAGLEHSLGLEYHFNKNLLLDLKYKIKNEDLGQLQDKKYYDVRLQWYSPLEDFKFWEKKNEKKSD